jgi:hypothetical protein
VPCPNCGTLAPGGAAECASCGLVFAKWKPRAERPEPAAPSAPARLPDAAFWGGVAALTALAFAARDGLRRAFFLLDGVDLGVHETGHLVFQLLGNRFLYVAGGTIGQLLMPAAFWWDFRRRGRPRSADACLIWVGQSLLNVGRYAADARAQELHLVAGGVHDWTYLLETVGLLTHDIGVGRAFDLAGCLLIAYASARLIRSFAFRPGAG